MTPTAFSIIASVERELRRETTQIEARHASIRRELVGLSVQTHTAFFAHLSAGRLTQEVRRMSKHVMPRQKPPSLQRETAALRKSSRNLTSVSGGHLMAALGCFSFGSKLEEREAQKSGAWPSWAGGTESWVRRSDWGSNEKGEKALKGDCAARASHLGRRAGPSRCEGRSIFGKQLLKP